MFPVKKLFFKKSLEKEREKNNHTCAFCEVRNRDKLYPRPQYMPNVLINYEMERGIDFM